MQRHEQEARDEHYRSLLKFHKEVWGWLIKRGLVDPANDEWRGFKEIIEEHKDEIEAATRRASKALDPVVKPLEWHAGRHGGVDYADTIIGTYNAWNSTRKNAYFMAPGMGTGCWVEGGLAEAKAAAQTHFEARIHSALAKSEG
ncbi:MAG: hypothetical protein EOQ44_25405 [Mesorhizobium sp.]|uniref:hypothetical protein n=1 Tax=Mesorhizobium sp. TaxID=1871066 RepID=UPI000FE78752|nr:hypothetical protein [Mesorhizobium sp.]RWB40478.1 MAG: hypothetical protein EOQ44_25405 [Mesorhizobium sp.]